MPNHVYQKLTAIGDLQKLTELALFTRCPSRTKESEWVAFSEDAFFPMPEDLRGTVSGSHAVITEKEYAILIADTGEVDRRKKSGGMPITYKMAAEYAEKYGATNWYDWANENWGTKWGTYSCDKEWRISINEMQEGPIGELSIRFQSAWSPATLIIQRLSGGFSALKFKLEYIDEGWNFAGSQVIARGAVIRKDSVDCEKNNPLFVDLARSVGYTIYNEED